MVGTTVNVLFLGHVNRALCGAKRVVAARLTSTWKRTMRSWLLAMKLLSRTPKLNQLPRHRNTLISIFSSLPVFSTHVVWEDENTTESAHWEANKIHTIK